MDATKLALIHTLAVLLPAFGYWTWCLLWKGE
jgi:hypothetical protein